MSAKDAKDWISRNPLKQGETVSEWRERYLETRTHRVVVPDPGQRSYERRLWWSMLARGVIAAYLLGLMLSLGETDPRNWQAFAGITAVCFLIAWIVSMNMEKAD